MRRYKEEIFNLNAYLFFFCFFLNLVCFSKVIVFFIGQTLLSKAFSNFLVIYNNV